MIDRVICVCIWHPILCVILIVNHSYSSPHNAVQGGGNFHLIEFNSMRNVCILTGDSGYFLFLPYSTVTTFTAGYVWQGAFYMGRDWTQQVYQLSFFLVDFNCLSFLLISAVFLSCWFQLSFLLISAVFLVDFSCLSFLLIHSTSSSPGQCGSIQLLLGHQWPWSARHHRNLFGWVFYHSALINPFCFQTIRSDIASRSELLAESRWAAFTWRAMSSWTHTAPILWGADETTCSSTTVYIYLFV